MYCYPLKCAMDWNPEKKGIISGALLSGLGFGAFSWNMIATLYINPENKSAGTNGKDLDSTEYNRVPSFFLLIGGVYAVLLFIAHVILIRPSDFENQNKLAENEHSAKNFSFKETLMNKKFWLLWLFFIPISLGGTLTSLVFREIGDFTDPSDTVLSLIGSIGLLLESTS